MHMMRAHIRRAGAVIAVGFLCASALANFSFGVSLGRSTWEAQLYGFVGVLAVAMNAVSPFFLSWSVTAARRSAAIAIALLWVVCLIYSTTSALGFAAQNRETVAQSRESSREAYDDVRRELLDLEGRRQSARAKERSILDAKIDDARLRLSRLREQRPVVVDAQSTFLSSLSFGLVEPQRVRQALVALFALMVELGATLGLFAALSHSPAPPAQTARWKPHG
jgi:hypothetical protein